ncbi:hypothetical protein Taro_018051 [Colocasia esculenta]|uniref:Uncharacterized protein n=1 Tax=Colocasia esculenta TaxID=4460 RepID=A0A843UST4_COLES|nr:hypothetical protein [Colocasia esculenta]
MRGECPEVKKKLKKNKFTFKKAKAMMATWSDEDEDDNAHGRSEDEEIQCLMARSEDSNEVDTSSGQVDTGSENKLMKLKRILKKKILKKRLLKKKILRNTLLKNKFHKINFLKHKINRVRQQLEIAPPHSDLTFSMAPPSKRLASRRRPISPKADNGSRAPAERRSKHRDDWLLELIVSPNRQTSKVRGSFTKFVQPRFVDFKSLEDMFPSLQPLFDTQGWTTFLYSHKWYSPVTVTEFYNNLEFSVQSDELYTTTGESQGLSRARRRMLNKSLIRMMKMMVVMKTPKQSPWMLRGMMMLLLKTKHHGIQHHPFEILLLVRWPNYRINSLRALTISMLVLIMLIHGWMHWPHSCANSASAYQALYGVS